PGTRCAGHGAPGGAAVDQFDAFITRSARDQPLSLVSCDYSVQELVSGPRFLREAIDGITISWPCGVVPTPVGLKRMSRFPEGVRLSPGGPSSQPLNDHWTTSRRAIDDSESQSRRVVCGGCVRVA